MLESQLHTYRIAASQHGRATLDGDALAANAAYDILQSVFKELCREGTISELASLLLESDTSVQLWAASHLLSIGNVDGLDALKRIQLTECSALGMSAKYVIKQWESGLLRFP